MTADYQIEWQFEIECTENNFSETHNSFANAQ